MKRATNAERNMLARAAYEYIKRGCVGNHWELYRAVQALLHSDARQRAEIRALREALLDVHEALVDDEDKGLAIFTADEIAVAAIAPKRRARK